MKPNVIKTLYHAPGVRYALAALLFVLGATCTARAWTTNDTYQCWTGFDNNFYVTYTQSGHTDAYFSQNQNGTTRNRFWQSAELIEMAVDADYYAANYYVNPDMSKYVNEVNALCHGFEDYNGADWSADPFNDDLNWATIAFVRAYQVTRNTQWLNDAKLNWTNVWNRARMGNPPDALHYGLRQQMVGTNVDSPVNYTFVIAGYLLYNNTGDPAYKSHADSVWQFSAIPQGHLYDSSSGKVPDSVTGATDYSYNYGIAIHAAVLEGDMTTCQNMAQHLAFNFGGSSYKTNGLWEGYDVLPNYGFDGNNGGYNGICLRGVGYALSRGYLTTSQAAWAMANVDAAFYHRNTSTQLMWDDWQNHTPATGNLSWDCSSALSGMLNIPPQSQ